MLPIECHFNHYLAKRSFQLTELSRWLHHLSWTAATNYFLSAGFKIWNIVNNPLQMSVFFSKVGILRNALLFLWILSMCEALTNCPGNSFGCFFNWQNFQDGCTIFHGRQLQTIFFQLALKFEILSTTLYKWAVFFSKVGILRNALLFLWILSMCEALTNCPGNSFGCCLGLYYGQERKLWVLVFKLVQTEDFVAKIELICWNFLFCDKTTLSTATPFKERC